MKLTKTIISPVLSILLILSISFLTNCSSDSSNNDGSNDNANAAPIFSGATSATADSTSAITISWSAATDDTSAASAIVYDIYQATSAGGQSYSSPSYTTTAGATSYQVTGLSSLTDYYFVVRARDEAGNSDGNTTEVTARTDKLLLSEGDLVITEIMANPNDVDDSDGEYIEIYNASGKTIDFSVNNVILEKVASTTATYTISTGTVDSGDYFLLCNNVDSTENSGITTCDTIFDVGGLTNGGANLNLTEDTTAIDTVTYASSTDEKSFELATNKLTADNSNTATNWGLAVSTYGDGNNYGTPGTINDYTN